MRRAPYPHLQRGNILFLILLAVVLFAALSYAVTGSQRGTVKDASGDKVELAASQIMQKGQMVEAAVMRLKLTKDCKDTEISFENPTVSGYTNSSTPADGHCKVFDQAGGGLSWLSTPDGAVEGTSEMFQYTMLPVAGVGAWIETTPTRCVLQSSAIQDTCRDLVMILAHVPEAVCTVINQKTQLRASFGENGAVGNGANSATKFVGSYSNGPDDIWAPGNPNYGRLEGCYQQLQVPYSDYMKWFYYKVLIAR